MKKITKTKSDHARKLFEDGHSTAEVARISNINYGHAWNIRKSMLAKVQAEPTPEPAPVVDKPEQLEKILDKRAEQYGTFMRNADIAIKLKQVIHNAMVREDTQLYPDQLQALDMIVTKIGRILTGNPSHLDSWIDIAGYAKLVSDRLQGNAR
jgi:hypothetical protein